MYVHFMVMYYIYRFILSLKVALKSQNMLL